VNVVEIKLHTASFSVVYLLDIYYIFLSLEWQGLVMNLLPPPSSNFSPLGKLLKSIIVSSIQLENKGIRFLFSHVEL
jgi:hypothetical protein